MNSKPRTRLALIGTMSDLHSQPVAYDLHTLRKIVAELSPDLLCAEITKADWEGGDMRRAALEVREALAPVAASTDTVLVPVAPTAQQFADFAPPAGWRRNLVRAFDRLLRWGQREANDAEAVNGPLFGAFCHTLCILSEAFWTKENHAAWGTQNRALAENIVSAVRRDEGSRVLVAVQCQRLHTLIPLLKSHSILFEVVKYQDL